MYNQLKSSLFVSCRLEEEKKKLYGLQEELNGFRVWLEDAEEIASTPAEQGNELQLNELLEKVKVWFITFFN